MKGRESWLPRHPSRWTQAHPRLARWVLALAVLAGLHLAWLLTTGLAVQDHLGDAREDLLRTRSAIESGDAGKARSSLTAAQAETSAARRLTTGPLWSAASRIPLLGRSPAAVLTAARVADEVTGTVLPPLATAAEAFDLTALRSGGIDLEPVAGLVAPLERARTTLRGLRRQSAAVRGPLIWPVSGGVRDLRTELASVSDLVDLGLRAGRLLPPMLGDGGPRTYLLAVQNPAEARGTGGLLGAYGIVTAEGGELSVREIGPNSNLRSATRLPVDLGPDFRELYGQDPALWVNANLSPYFPYAAKIWLALWQRQFDERLDGVIAVDPVVLGDLVGAAGPVRLPDGTRLTGANTADFVMSGVYRRYPSFAEDEERDLQLAELGRTVVDKLLGKGIDYARVAEAVSRNVGQRRVLVYSDHADEQRQLAGTTLSGAPARTAAPRLEVVVNNGGANKLDYYLDRSVRWELGSCADGTRRSRVTVRLHSDAPPTGLPAYVVGNVDVPADGIPIPKGTNRLLVAVFSTAGSRLTGGDLDGGLLKVRRGHERGQPVTSFTVDVAAGETRTIVLDLVEPARPESPDLIVQPLVRKQRSVVTSTSCVT